MEFWNWYLNANAVLVVFGLFYWLLLRRERNLRLNRAILLAIPPVAALLPLIPMSMPGAVYDGIVLQDQLAFSRAVLVIQRPLFQDVYFTVLVGGAALLSIVLLWRFTQVALLIGKGRTERVGSFKMLHYDTPQPVFSFMNWIHIPAGMDSKDEQALLQHELAHVQFGHSWDVLFYQIVKVVFYLNPLAYVLFGQLRSVHEYQADERAADYHTDYSNLLVEQCLMGRMPALAHQFSHSSHLKNRIVMLQKKSSRLGVFKQLLMLPLAAAMLMTFNPSFAIAQNSTEKVYEKVDEMPQFKGGMDGLINYMIAEVKYPEGAKANNTQGKVMVSFVVAANGRIKDVAVKKGTDPELDAEAVRCVKAMPNWQPGTLDGKAVAVAVVLPVQFKL